MGSILRYPWCRQNCLRGRKAKGARVWKRGLEAESGGNLKGEEEGKREIGEGRRRRAYDAPGSLCDVEEELSGRSGKKRGANGGRRICSRIELPGKTL